ncbi:putative C6 transcription factor [Rosellinia necatrix]|uniref:Putative C6 transcription factor n=1 Tax=Rosellinia necatrix TaxID=77044 RepID=A0A1W2TWD9_ROSNE|nr:putative C6 transcription factor [Rosellinia necatrix]
MDRLDEVHQTLNQLANMTRDIVARPCCHDDAYISGITTGNNGNTNLNTAAIITTASNSPSRTAAIAAIRAGFESNNHFILPHSNDTIFDLPNNERGLTDSSYFPRESSTHNNGEQSIIGSPDSLTLIQGIAGQISGMLRHHDGREASHDVRDAGTRVALHRLRNSFPFDRPCHDSDVIDDGRPVSTPPRLMVDLFIESFLCSFNASFSIFDEEELRNAVDAHYAAEQPNDNSPWALIFTNIVVLGLGLEAQTASASRSHTKSMHHELMASFLRNCDRAIANLDSFTRPSIVNIQALLTLALVGREFYGNTIFEKACQIACHLASIVGLHRSKPSRSDIQSPDISDRQRLFRALYTIDKYRTFLSGHPCDLYLFDSEAQPSSGAEESSPVIQLDSAFYEMMRIWEEIYLTLYSTRASLANINIRSQRVSAMSELATSWAQQHSGLIISSDSAFESGTEPRRLELTYCYHVTQVLILRCGGKDHKKKLLDHARACLRVMATVINMPATVLSLASLARMLQHYPIASFTELLRFHLLNLSRDIPLDDLVNKDVELLRHINNSIKAMQHPDLPQTYLSRLGVGINWLLGVLEAITNTTSGSPSASVGKARHTSTANANAPSSRPSSNASPVAVMPTVGDSVWRQRTSRGFSLPSSISSSSERGHRYLPNEAELPSFEAPTPFPDPVSINMGRKASSSGCLYLDGPQFDTAMIDDESWGVDLWKDVFPS